MSQRCVVVGAGIVGVTLAAHLATLSAGEILTQTDHDSLAPYRLQRFTTAA